MSDSSLPVLVRRSDGKRFRITIQARSPNGPVSLVACDGPPFENVETTNDKLARDFDDSRKTPSHRWVSDDEITHGSARCEKCGLYVVAAIDLTDPIGSAVLVAGRYINGGLHMNNLASRVRLDAQKHGCTS